MAPDLSAMDFVRDALANAKASNMTLDDVIACAEHSRTCEKFNHTVNLMGETCPR